MAISDAHFKAPVGAKASGASMDIPIEALSIVGGVAALFLIVLAVIWMRISRAGQVPDQ